MLRRLRLLLPPLAVVALVLGGVAYLGRLAVEQLRDHDRYARPLRDVRCPAPPGMTRPDFLDEVQYLSGLPGRLPLLHDDLPPRLAAAFARHPWVARVDRVRVLPAGVVEAELTFRRPVLAVRWAGQIRAVDADAVLLPSDAATAGLPLFVGQASPPEGPAGTPWGDPAVARAAREAAERLPPAGEASGVRQVGAEEESRRP